MPATQKARTMNLVEPPGCGPPSQDVQRDDVPVLLPSCKGLFGVYVELAPGCEVRVCFPAPALGDVYPL